MIVLDCCAAVDMVRNTPEGSVLRSLVTENEVIISSDLLHAELGSAFGKYVRAKMMSEKEAHACLDDALILVEHFVAIEENYQEAYHESLRLNHSIYDMLYFTLARRNGATLMTLDAKLLKLCEEQGIPCVCQMPI